MNTPVRLILHELKLAKGWGIWYGSYAFNEAGEINKDGLKYKLMVRQPEFVTESVARMTVVKLISTKPHPLIKYVKFGAVGDGMCVQLMHTGSYDSERQSFEKMNAFIEENGLERKNFLHRETYINDPRKTVEEKRKTVLRYMVEKNYTNTINFGGNR